MTAVSSMRGWKLDALGNVKAYLTVNEPALGDASFDVTIDFAGVLAAKQGCNIGGNGT